MSIIKKNIHLVHAKIDPIGYAKKQGVRVGVNCRFGSTMFGSEPWLITVGNHVLISGNVQFITHDGATWCFREQERYKDVLRFGKIVINDNCFIGNRSVILPGITIGPNSIVGAGSVVTKDVPMGMVVAGNPARVVCSVSEFAEKCLRETSKYDKSEFVKNKKDTVLKMLSK